MDIATLIGIVAGLGLIIGSIAAGGPLDAFLNLSGLMIVAGGTVAATLIAQQLKVAMGALKVALNAIVDRTPSIDETIAQVQALSNKVRAESILALENVKLRDRFMAKGVRLAVDGVDLQFIRATLEAELVTMQARHQRGQKVFRFMGATAPAMGMVGTLIGLVQMLRVLNDPSAIGPAMAMALLTTLYGAILAFLLFNPIADKLEQRTRDEAANVGVILQGLESIIKGDNAVIVKERMDAFIEPQRRRAARS